jgi:ABC-type multidrug transport system fused ATPase/permease subunit
MGLGYGLGLLLVISVSAFFITSIVVINQYIAKILVLWCDNILDATESVTSLQEFEYWLERTCNWRLHLLVTIIGGLLLGSYFVVMSSTRVGVFVGYGSTFGIIISIILDCTLLYSFLMAILLSARLRRYDLKLFAADPSSSEFVSRLSGELGSIVYFVAVLAAYVTLISTLSGFFLSLGIILVIVLWLPIIAMFILNQTGLSSIIRRAKWKTLNEIQVKVEKLQAAENFEDKETMDAINRLMDYHDRVKATRNSAIDLGTILHFINSLLLPLLAFLIGNLELVLKLFTRKP